MRAKWAFNKRVVYGRPAVGPSGKEDSFPPHSRHCLSGISFGLVSDGSLLATCGDDDRFGFGLDHRSMPSDTVRQLISRF